MWRPVKPVRPVINARRRLPLSVGFMWFMRLTSMSDFGALPGLTQKGRSCGLAACSPLRAADISRHCASARRKGTHGVRGVVSQPIHVNTFTFRQPGDCGKARVTSIESYLPRTEKYFSCFCMKCDSARLQMIIFFEAK